MSRRDFVFAVALAAVLATPVALLADAPPAKGPKPIHVSMGQLVKVTDYVVPGKTTIVDFYSEFCPPCRAIAPRLEKLHASRDDIVVVKVDINRPGVKGIDWKSPVAQQYQLHSIPHFKIFGPDGKLQTEGDQAYEMVNSWIQ